MNCTSPIGLARRHAAALVLLIAPFAVAGRADAACDPASPIAGSGVTVTCLGTTTNQNGNNGYGSSTDTGNTINVLPGASVTGTVNGLIFNGGTVNNSGTISGRTAIDAGNGTSTVNNAGIISATDTGLPGRHAIGISGGNGTLTVINSGTILATATDIAVNANSIFGRTLTVINSGTIGASIFANDTANITNSGTISGGLFTGGDATVTNSGTFSDRLFALGSAKVMNSGTMSGISSHINADVTNSGTISVGVGRVGVLADRTANVTNSGTISAASAFGQDGFGIQGSNVNVINSGTIRGSTGIVASLGGPDFASTIVNSGTIIGTGGTAIKLNATNDTLTLLPGSRIIGAIDMGGDGSRLGVPVQKDVVNFTAGRDVAQLVTLTNFTGTINSAAGGPQVHSAAQIATLDPTGFAQADRTLMDFTGGVSSLVQGRLGGMTPTGLSMQVGSFGPENSSGAFAGVSSAMAYGPDNGRLIGKAPAADYYSAPTVIWANSFGGVRTQDATDSTLRATSSAWGGVIGIDRKVRSDLMLGAFVGGGAGRLNIDKGSQSVDTDYIVGGVYGRFDRASHFFDFTLQGGRAANKSTRVVASNLAADGIENAFATYNGWFISPEVAYGVRHALGNGTTLTPTARVRYMAGMFGGYSESGSAQNLSVGSHTLQDIEERGEIELARTASFGLADTIKATLHGGVIALQRLGDTNVNTVLIGQNLTFATPGRDSAVGVVAGAGFDYRTGERMSIFGAVEGALMSDKSRTGTARGGLRLAF